MFNEIIATIGLCLSFIFFLDSIDDLLNKEVSKQYKITRTIAHWFVIFAMMHFYFVL